jgi:hypothetical protein
MSVITTEKPKILNTIGLASKKYPAINKRIEVLGKLNDRRLKARGAGDRWALIEVSYGYAEIGCPRMASEILTEAEGL